MVSLLRDSRGRFIKGTKTVKLSDTVSVTAIVHERAHFEEKLDAFKDLQLTIGFQGRTGRQLYPLGFKKPGTKRVSVAQVATYQEFGTIDIPARSMLRGTLFERREDIRRSAVREFAMFMAIPHADPVATLSRIGADVASFVAQRIERSRSWAKKNAPSTVKKKGFDNPLHETDLMANSVTWAVRRGGSIIAEGPGRP